MRAYEAAVVALFTTPPPHWRDVDATARGSDVEAVSERNRAYFRAHPEREDYVRRRVPGEFGAREALADCDGVTHVLVQSGTDPVDGTSLVRLRRAIPGCELTDEQLDPLAEHIRPMADGRTWVPSSA